MSGEKTLQELRKLPYTSYLESQVYMSVLSVLDHDYHLDHDDHLNHDDHLVPDDYHNYDDLGDHDDHDDHDHDHDHKIVQDSAR